MIAPLSSSTVLDVLESSLGRSKPQKKCKNGLNETAAEWWSGTSKNLVWHGMTWHDIISWRSVNADYTTMIVDMKWCNYRFCARCTSAIKDAWIMVLFLWKCKPCIVLICFVLQHDATLTPIVRLEHVLLQKCQHPANMQDLGTGSRLKQVANVPWGWMLPMGKALEHRKSISLGCKEIITFHHNDLNLDRSWWTVPCQSKGRPNLWANASKAYIKEFFPRNIPWKEEWRWINDSETNPKILILSLKLNIDWHRPHTAAPGRACR